MNFFERFKVGKKDMSSHDANMMEVPEGEVSEQETTGQLEPILVNQDLDRSPLENTKTEIEQKSEEFKEQLDKWEHVEDLTEEQMTEMFKDDGMALIHAGSTSSLKSGILTPSGIRDKRGEPVYDKNRYGIWFNLNKVFEGDSKKILHLFHPGVVYTRFIHSERADRGVAQADYLLISNAGPIESSEHDLPADYGIVLLPKSREEDFEKIFQQNGYRPRFIYYYNGENGEDGYKDWMNSLDIPEADPIRFKDVYNSRYEDIWVGGGGLEIEKTSDSKSPDGYKYEKTGCGYKSIKKDI